MFITAITGFSADITFKVAIFVAVSGMCASQNNNCTKCVCDHHLCDHNPCCQRVDTDHLVYLEVSVSCHAPDRARVQDPRYTFDESEQCGGYHLYHTNSCLSVFPDNICDYDNIRAITLSWTALSEFPDLHCLSELRLLDLSHNRLTSVPHDAFRGLKKLRVIYLDNNQITHIHPNALDVPLPQLNILSVKHNLLVTTENWVLALHHRFCLLDFSHNRLQYLTNERNATVDLSPNVQYGNGYVDLTYNQFSVPPWTQFDQYGVTIINFLGKFLSSSFDLRYNPFHCDCKTYDVVVWIRRMEQVMFRAYYDLICATPERLRGRSFRDLQAEELVCEITEDCPRSCFCLRRPLTEYVVINCTGRGLSELPEVMPKDKLRLLLSNNSLSHIHPKEYLAQVVWMNLSHNRIQTIDADVPRLLRNTEALDLRKNALRELPGTLQAVSPAVVFLDPDTLQCSCDLSWFPDWIQYGRSSHLSDTVCRTKGYTVRLPNASRHGLGCTEDKDASSPYKLALICLAGAVVLGAVLFAVFRYEVLVLTHTLIHACKARRKASEEEAKPPFFHVFLCCANDSETDGWVNSELLPALERRELRSYWPRLDCPPGKVEIDEITKGLNNSKTALVVVSPECVNSPASLFQFKQAYNRMMGKGQLILLYVRPVSRCAVPEPRMRAMITLKMYHKVGTPGSLEKVLDKLSGKCGHRILESNRNQDTGRNPETNRNVDANVNLETNRKVDTNRNLETNRNTDTDATDVGHVTLHI